MKQRQSAPLLVKYAEHQQTIENYLSIRRLELNLRLLGGALRGPGKKQDMIAL